MSNILLVDDEQANRRMVQTMLQEAGHQITAASNGEGALAQLELQTFELLITDMHMPVMDGITLISQCRSRFPDLPVIAISGGDFAGDASKLASAGLMGALETLQKPFSEEELQGAVERAVSHVPSEIKLRGSGLSLAKDPD